MESKLKNQINPNICLNLKHGNNIKSQLFLQRGQILNCKQFENNKKFIPIRNINIKKLLYFPNQKISLNSFLIDQFLNPLDLSFFVKSKII